MQPSAEQIFSYRECLRFDQQRATARSAGLSGLLSGNDTATHAHHYEIIAAALGAGVSFDLLQ